MFNEWVAVNGLHQAKEYTCIIKGPMGEGGMEPRRFSAAPVAP